ncbi:MAG: type I polyketide synthase, partial [Dermatophilaceae bacterium]
MSEYDVHPVAVVGISAIMPQAPDGDAFWANIRGGRYCITEVPQQRWDPAAYYSPDHSARDKSYSKIGGWVRDFDWDPIAWRLPIPPMVAAQMDEGQRWALSAARRALLDAGWPGWGVDNERVAVILGNAIGGEKHYISSMRIRLPEVLRHLEQSATLQTLPPQVQHQIVDETRGGFLATQQEITEDTMPGELSNVIAGRISNVLNLRGPNFTTDAACASGLAALSSAVLGLTDHQYDAVISGGIDRNMGVDAFVKFSKIGALSATGTRPFDAGADGFVMGEGAALFVLKRLADAERDGDRVYAVILSIGGSSDGKGKGITAPNPIGQQLAVSRAWERSGVDPATVSAIEAHGTSTSVGDAAELASLETIFGAAGVAPRSVALGSVKSNIGHLKAAAGTAGLYKMVRSLHEKVLAPSLNFVRPNENVDWDTTPCYVNTELRDWPTPPSGVRRAGVSAFGFGGTNFHVVLEEHVPGAHRPPARVLASAEVPRATVTASAAPAVGSATTTSKPALRGALVLGGRDDADVLAQVRAALADAQAGRAPAPAAPDPALADAAVRVAVDYADAAELAGKLDKLAKGMASGNPAVFRMLRQQGVFLGRGPAPKLAFLYTGQGSQYVNMVKALYDREPIVAQTFADADRVMTPLLGRPLTSFIFVDPHDTDAVTTANQQLMQTEITQPAVLSTDLALTRLLAAYRITPDMVMGHSLGEYGALVAAGSLDFDAALEAVSARGREMANLSVPDNGAMAAVFGPLPQIERIVAEADGYVVIANINSYSQAVVGGATEPVERVVERFQAAGMNAMRIPVSHAFHTEIVAPASPAFITSLRRLDLRPPTLPIVANVTGEFYPPDADTELMLDFAGRQIASPVQFVKGLQTLYDAGARVFVEVGPKKALHGFAEDVLSAHHDDVLALFTNHPKVPDDVAVNQALCGLYAAGHGFAEPAPAPVVAATTSTTGSAAVAPVAPGAPSLAAPAPAPVSASAIPAAGAPTPGGGPSDDVIRELGQLFAGVLEQGMRLYGFPGAPASQTQQPEPVAAARPAPGAASAPNEPVVITGAALGLPGVERAFDDENVARILAGQQFITSLPRHVRERLADMNITRLVKDASGGGSFHTIDDPSEVIKLAGRTAPVDLVEQFGIDAARDEALDETTRLAVAAGFDALRDAGIPLGMQYKTTTLGTLLPDRWGLPEALREDTGIIFPSAFPGYDRFAEALEAYAVDRTRRESLLALEGVRAQMSGAEPAAAEVDRLIAQLREALQRAPFVFDRRFIFRVLAMGHAQFAEIIGARGPNIQTNAACASTTQALSLAEDWIRAGRCRRVVIISADNATGEHVLPWVTGGFLASGAAATDERVEDAATPFDRRRHGMIVGSGAAALVVESADAARERGIQPICEVLAAVTANSAFHGSRLDVEHIGGVMDALVAEAEQRGVTREAIAARTVFVSHETYTPARGGSASAEVNALRRIFGDGADRVVVTNTKGLTGHAMGAGIEDVVAVKSLETGIVPPVVNFKEPDPELGPLNLSNGGEYPLEYALRLAAGFGSQIAMTLMRWTPMPDKRHRRPDELGYGYRVVDPAAWQGWLDRLSGRTGSTLEVDHRRLRIVDTGAPPGPVTRHTHVPVPYAGRLAPTAPAAATPAAAAVRAATTASTPSHPSAVPHAAPTDGVPTAATAQGVPSPAPASVAAAAPAGAPTPAQPTPGSDPALEQVTAIVADLTGYPPDLLDPDLDLEADLGVDTV